MKAAVKDFFNDSEEAEQESSEDTAWRDNFIQIGGSWYSKREMIHTRCNTCEAHTEQIFYQNEDDSTCCVTVLDSGSDGNRADCSFMVQ